MATPAQAPSVLTERALVSSCLNPVPGACFPELRDLLPVQTLCGFVSLTIFFIFFKAESQFVAQAIIGMTR